MNARRVAATFVTHVKQFTREKSTMFFVLLFPVLLILMFGFIFQEQGGPIGDLHIQDLDGGQHALALVDGLNSSGAFNLVEVPADVNASQYFADHRLNLMLVIPDGYSEALNMKLANESMPPASITMLYDQGNTYAQTKMSVLLPIMDGLNKAMSGSTDYVVLVPETVITEEFKFIDFFAPGIIAMSVMTTSLFGTVGMNTELRQKGILRKLATTPLTRTEWLLSNILYQLFMSLLSTACILAVGMGVFGLKPHLNLYLLLFVVLNVFSFAGIGMLITRFVKEAESAQAAANAVMFPMMFLSGTFFQLEMMPDFLQVLARFLPLYYVNEGMRAAMISLDHSIITESAAVIGIFGMLVFALGIRLTSWKDE